MLLQELINKLQNVKKGAFVKISYKSQPKLLKAHKEEQVEKVTNGVYRLGISYANMKINKNKITGSLPFGEWVGGLENYIITHTNKNGETKTYLRVYTTKHHAKVKWVLNGQETTKQHLLDNGYFNENKSTHTELFIVPIENVISIG